MRWISYGSASAEPPGQHPFCLQQRWACAQSRCHSMSSSSRPFLNFQLNGYEMARSDSRDPAPRPRRLPAMACLDNLLVKRSGVVDGGRC